MAANFGVLNKGLQGSHLRIGDQIVIDRDRNILVGNIGSGTLTTHEGIFTPALVEDKSFEGIRLHGNLLIQPGSFLIGDVDMGGVINEDLTVGGTGLFGGNVAVGESLFTSSVRPETVGATTQFTGNVRMHQRLTVMESVSADSILVDNLIAQPSDTINILGSLTLIEGSFRGNVVTQSIASASAAPVTLNGGLTVTNGCFQVPKSVSLPSSVSASLSTAAGVVNLELAADAPPNASVTIALINECIESDSVILCNIGSYSGVGIPIVSGVSPSMGTASITITNVGAATIPMGVVIPINFLIV